MKVKVLIRNLSRMDPDADVILQVNHWRLADVERCVPLRLARRSRITAHLFLRVPKDGIQGDPTLPLWKSPSIPAVLLSGRTAELRARRKKTRR